MNQQTKMEYVFEDKTSDTLKNEKLEVEQADSEQAAEKRKGELKQKSEAIIQGKTCFEKQPSFKTKKQIISRYKPQELVRKQDPVVKFKEKEEEKKLQDENKELEKQLNIMKEKLHHASQEWTKCTWTNRKLKERIQALTAQVDVLQQACDEHKNENKALIDKVNYVKNLYFKERMKNLKLKEVLRKKSLDVPDNYYDASAFDLPEGEQCHTEIDTTTSENIHMSTTHQQNVQARVESKGKSHQGINRHQKVLEHESDHMNSC